MIYHDFSELRAAAVGGGPVSCGVVMPRDDHTMEAVETAERLGLITPVLIEAETAEKAMEAAVGLVHEGRVQMLMKGMLQTAEFMRAVVKRENGLRTGSLIQMLTLRKLPTYHKLVALTDTGICEQPTLEQKQELLQNAVNALTQMGFDRPKVAVLSAAETVNRRMQSSTDGAALKEMWLEGKLAGCDVEGPISIDLALSAEAAQIKGYTSPVAGDADLLLFPDLTSANIAGKLLANITQTPAGILILGAKIPLVVCSRAASVATKVQSITMAAAYMKK